MGGKGWEGEGVNVSFLVLKTTTSSTLCFFCLLGTITNFAWSPDTYCCYYNSNPFLNMAHLKKKFLFKQQLYQSEDFFTVLSPDTACVILKVLSVLELLSTFSVNYPSITVQIWYTRHRPMGNIYMKHAFWYHLHYLINIKNIARFIIPHRFILYTYTGKWWGTMKRAVSEGFGVRCKTSYEKGIHSLYNS